MFIALVMSLMRRAKGLARLVADWFRPKAPAHRGQRTEERDQPTERVVMVTPEEAEQLLAAGLLAGLVGQAEYQDGLELVARADHERNPLEVPSLHGR